MYTFQFRMHAHMLSSTCCAMQFRMEMANAQHIHTNAELENVVELLFLLITI